jgi:hypothetical protein
VRTQKIFDIFTAINSVVLRYHAKKRF